MCIEISVDIGDIIAVLSLIATVCAHRSIVNRDKKINTVKEYTRIRNKYGNKQIPKRKRKEYLRDMEFFCTGINNGIYDINILKTMGGRRLKRQYEDYMKSYIQLRRKKSSTEIAWVEYEKVMKRLECCYCKKCPVIKWFCKWR